jgi:hypothetical protein
LLISNICIFAPALAKARQNTEKEIAKLNVEVSFYQIDVADENSWIEFSSFLKNKKNRKTKN